jgi:D-alanyl-D-alanine carboxypeptidase
MTFRSSIGCALLGLSAAIAGAAEPSSPARAQLDGFITAFNSGDRAKVEAFGREHAPPDFVRAQILDDTMRMFATTGGLDFVAVVESGAHSLTSQVRERKTGKLVKLSVAVDPAAPERITTILLTSAAAAVDGG